jgi:hypothetical protein
VQVVEHDQIDAAVRAARVGLHVWLDRTGDEQGRFGAFDRNVNQAERRNCLGDALLEDLKVVLGQGPDELTRLVHDHRVHLNVVDLHPKRDGRSLRGRLGCRLLPHKRARSRVQPEHEKRKRRDEPAEAATHAIDYGGPDRSGQAV